MTEQPGGAAGGPDLANYSGDGSDLTEEQRHYLATYMPHQVGSGGDVQHQVGQGALSTDAQGEWA